MSCNDESISAADPGGPGSSERQALFRGDQGDLPLETRRAFVQLLAGPSLEAKRHPKLWPALLRDEKVIRSRLSELFLDLALDREMQVAFIRQADVGELETPRLLRRAPLTFIDSVLMLFLRQELTRSESRGERAVTSIAEMHEHLMIYERGSSTDRAGFAKRVHASIEKAKRHSILRKIRASEDRFEISPTLKLLFSAEEVLALTEAYRRIAEGETPPDAPAAEDSIESEDLDL